MTERWRTASHTILTDVTVIGARRVGAEALEEAGRVDAVRARGPADGGAMAEAPLASPRRS